MKKDLSRIKQAYANSIACLNKYIYKFKKKCRDIDKRTLQGLGTMAFGVITIWLPTMVTPQEDASFGVFVLFIGIVMVFKLDIMMDRLMERWKEAMINGKASKVNNSKCMK